MTQPLFRVAQVFALRHGLVVCADIPVSNADSNLRIGDRVEFVRSDGARLQTVVRGIEMADPYDPDRSFAFLVGQELAKSDIELGAEVWRANAADA
jgi:hypothetical protein